jgi:hypothetical protein
MPTLNGKKFRTRSNTDNGEVSAQTVFNYSEADGLVWADYSGGAIRKGHLLGLRLPGDVLDFRYHHVNADLSIKTGVCRSAIHVGEDGKLILKEAWRWTCGDGSAGESEIVEI